MDNVQGATCGDDNGCITVSATGGVSPYNYAWSAGDGGNNPTSCNLPTGGPYTVTVTDANGCTATATARVGAADGPQITVDNVTPETCGQSNGSIEVTVTADCYAINF